MTPAQELSPVRSDGVETPSRAWLDGSRASIYNNVRRATAHDEAAGEP